MKMENPIQDLEFLDLSNINESEKHQLQSVLYASNPNARYPELPWPEGSMSVLHIVEPPPPPLDWMSHQQYAEGEEPLLNGTGEEEALEECLEEAQEEAGPPSAAHVYPGAPAAQGPPASGTPTQAPVYPPPFSHVYVNNMTANVSVHGYMHGAPVATPHPPPPSYHQMPGPMYTQEVPTPPPSGGQKKRFKGNSSNSGASRRIEHSQPPLEVPPHHPQHPGPVTYPFPGAQPGSTPPGYYPMYFHHGPPQHAQTGSPLYFPPPPHPMYHHHPHHGVPPPPQAMYCPPPPPHHGGIPPVTHVEESMQQQPYMQHHMDQQQQHHQQQHKSPHHQQSGVSQHQQQVKQHPQPITTMSSAPPMDNGHRQVQLNGDAEEWHGRNGNRPSEIVQDEEPYQEEERYQEDVEENYVEDEEMHVVDQGDVQSTSLNSSLSSSGLVPHIPPPSPHQEETTDIVAKEVEVASTSSQGNETQTADIEETEVSSTPPVANVASEAPKTWASLLKKSDVPQSSLLGSAASPGGLPKPCARVEPLTSSFNNYQTSASNDNNATVGTRFSNSGSGSQTGRTNGTGPRQSAGFSDDAASQNLGKLLLTSRLDHKGISLMPRGLINKSNYCYINATLQALIACPPFYNLLRSINKQRGGYPNSRGHYSSQSGADNHQSSTPIFNAMLQLANEFSYLQLIPGGNISTGRSSGGRRYDDQDLKIGAPFAPTYVYQILAALKSDSVFNVEGRQEDAEEFLTFLLNGLNDEMLELIKGQSPKESDANHNSTVSAGGKPSKNSSSPRATGLTNGEMNGDLNSGDADDGDWKEVTKDSKNKGAIVRRHTSVSDKTPVSEIFRGQVRTRVTRVSDSTVTENIQPFFTLALDIEKVNSVKEALDLLVLREGLEGVTSTKTNQETEAYQTVTIDELPFVLLLHLKCFDYKSHTCQKIMKSLEFPVLLSLEPKLLSNAKSKKLGGPNAPNAQKNKQYKLFAVVYHDGKEASKGHYITDVFHVGYSGWIRYDDANVRFVAESEVLHSKPPRVPYILYYRRADTIVSKNLSPTS